jgi:hypothetical protein
VIGDPVKDILHEMAEMDGLDVVVMDGRVWGRSRCPHQPERRRVEIRSTGAIDALLASTARCLASTCDARREARRTLAELWSVSEARQ